MPRFASHRFRKLALCALLAALAVSAAPARAELVLLTTGEVIKVDAFVAGAEAAKLTLPGGGVLTMPLLRVDRVIEDEIEFLVPAPEPEGAAPVLALSFTDGAPIPDGDYGGLAWWAAKKHALNPRLVAAVARAESNWNPRARSRKGACGLMQIMPATGRRFGLSRSELYDAKKNLEAGSRYLAWLVDRFDGDLELVLAAYNAGEGAVDRYGGVPPYRETREYIKRIYAYLGIEPAPPSALAAAVETAAVLPLIPRR